MGAIYEPTDTRAKIIADYPGSEPLQLHGHPTEWTVERESGVRTAAGVGGELGLAAVNGIFMALTGSALEQSIQTAATGAGILPNIVGGLLQTGDIILQSAGLGGLGIRGLLFIGGAVGSYLVENIRERGRRDGLNAVSLITDGPSAGAPRSHEVAPGTRALQLALRIGAPVLMLTFPHAFLGLAVVSVIGNVAVSRRRR